MKDLFSFIALMAIFLLAYGVTTHGLYLYLKIYSHKI